MRTVVDNTKMILFVRLNNDSDSQLYLNWISNLPLVEPRLVVMITKGNEKTLSLLPCF